LTEALEKFVMYSMLFEPLVKMVVLPTLFRWIASKAHKINKDTINF